MNDTHGDVHVVPPRIFVLVFVALLVLLLATFGAAHIDLGPFNIVLALAIAIVKMMLVVLVFMELKWTSRLTWVVAGASLFWLMIMLALTLADIFTRHAIPGVHLL